MKRSHTAWANNSSAIFSYSQKVFAQSLDGSSGGCRARCPVPGAADDGRAWFVLPAALEMFWVPGPILNPL